MASGGFNSAGNTFFQAPFAVGADNGTSVDPVTGRVVLGNALGAVGTPARLLDFREIDAPPGTGIAIFHLADASAPTFLIMPAVLQWFRNCVIAPILQQWFNTGPTPGNFLLSFDPENNQRVEFQYTSTFGTSIIFHNSGLIELVTGRPMANGPGIQLGTTGSAGLAWVRQVTDLPAGVTVIDLVGTCSTIYTDFGAGGAVTANVGAATNIGARFTFLNRSGNVLTMIGGPADTWRIAGVVGVAGGNIASAVIGDCITVEAVGVGVWVATSVVGVGWVVT